MLSSHGKNDPWCQQEWQLKSDFSLRNGQKLSHSMIAHTTTSQLQWNHETMSLLSQHGNNDDDNSKHISHPEMAKSFPATWWNTSNRPILTVSTPMKPWDNVIVVLAWEKLSLKWVGMTTEQQFFILSQNGRNCPWSQLEWQVKSDFSHRKGKKLSHSMMAPTITCQHCQISQFWLFEHQWNHETMSWLSQHGKIVGFTWNDNSKVICHPERHKSFPTAWWPTQSHVKIIKSPNFDCWNNNETMKQCHVGVTWNDN